VLVRQKLESIPITVDSESTKQLLRSSHRAPSLARALPSRDFRCSSEPEVRGFAAIPQLTPSGRRCSSAEAIPH
jgi:hypothetical protein